MKPCHLFLGALLAHAAPLLLAADKLETGFRQPPGSARPWVYWFPLDGNITREGITLDLEAMKRVGIGGVLYMETDQGAPRGPAAFAGPLWRELFQHICAEANRLGLEVNMNNDAGWCGSGGPWITPELSMQRIVWAETNLVGPKRFQAALPQPAAVKDFYRDIALFAFPTPHSDYVIPHLSGKSARTREEIPLRDAFPSLPDGTAIARDRVINLTDQLSAQGQLSWDVPAGPWTLLRLGCTTTGKDNHPAPIDGRGLECDKLSKTAAEAHFNGLMAKLIADNKNLAGENRTLVSTHIDSWEVGSQNWTPNFRQEFLRLWGYDPLPFLPVISGRVIDNLEISERFLYDVRMTVNQLILENYAGHFRTLAHQNGLRLSIEAYDGVPADDMTYAGRADEPMGEWWSYAPYSGAHWCTEMASAAHVYGKRILGAEAFTATDAEKWQAHPGSIKAMGDWAFCEGINRFVFHRYALQPWKDARPGMSMGPWGLHYERTQTWWEQSKAWHEYLARCQFLLQQGLFVADLCFLAPEMSPQRFKSPVKSGIDRPEYNFDGCPPEVVLTRMKVRDGRLILPDGMSYRMLVLPRAPVMTPVLLRKIKELVASGATVAGAPPTKSPSLSNYPQCDREVAALAAELWGSGPAPAELTERAFGKGRLIWGGELTPPPPPHPEDDQQLGKAKWIWSPEGNPAISAPPGKRYFRRTLPIDTANQITSARMLITADNSFECWINGRQAGAGDDFKRGYILNLESFLKPGANLIAVAAVNATDSPNPAGLIGSLVIKYANGQVQVIPTDRNWQATTTVRDNWISEMSDASGWTASIELGSLGMDPWGDVESGLGASDPIPDVNILCHLLTRMNVPPDFTCQVKSSSASLRYIHKRIDQTDVYFVANKNPQPEEALCSFRVTGKRPELWWPDSGLTERAAAYDEANGLTRVPIRFEPHGSVFVVFREKSKPEPDRILSVSRNGEILIDTAHGAPKQTMAATSSNPPASTAIKSSTQQDPIRLIREGRTGIQARVYQPGAYLVKTAKGQHHSFEIPSLPTPFEIPGPWEVQFDPKWGGPGLVTFNKLEDWSQRSETGVRYYSGTAIYRKTFSLAGSHVPSQNSRTLLDLGQVAVMAEVTLNGANLGILWKPPFQVDVTGIIKPGPNTLEVKVVNLWINRQIGDEQLPEDSQRNPNGTLKEWPQWVQEGKSSPTGRYTFTSWRLWKKDDPLAASGLLGPVVLHSGAEIKVR